MRPVRSAKNQYQGINAHLHSYWQAEGGWNGFHTAHIGDLGKTLKARLLPMGYTADLEPSLQIRRLDHPIGEPESDVTIYDLDPVRSRQPHSPHSPRSEVLVLPIPELLNERPLSEKQFQAVAIYELSPGKRGQPVAWIELLSPSNKGSSQDAETYREKRSKLLQSGIVFVEVDYLHESAPTLHKVADYRARKGQTSLPGSHPYRIAVMDPRPRFVEGLGHVVEFDVDAPIPIIDIPLNAGDMLGFDFGVPYAKTFEEMLYGAEFVDYSQFPVRFDRYSLDDQARIAGRMLAVLEAARDGVDLENRPFPVKPISLEHAIAQIEVINEGPLR
jgi:hypothetical protein